MRTLIRFTAPLSFLSGGLICFLSFSVAFFRSCFTSIVFFSSCVRRLKVLAASPPLLWILFGFSLLFLFRFVAFSVSVMWLFCFGMSLFLSRVVVCSVFRWVLMLLIFHPASFPTMTAAFVCPSVAVVFL
ncbi:hypothetical protein QL285_050060 [Trifolium repens]|nr:hypothetical protein QL285_050060 [Trifolium repens]